MDSERRRVKKAMKKMLAVTFDNNSVNRSRELLVYGAFQGA